MATDERVVIHEETILSESDDEASASTAISTTAESRSSSRPRRRCSQMDYSKYYDSDDEKQENKKTRESLAKSSHEVINTAEFLEYLVHKKSVVKTCENLYFHDYDINIDALVSLLKKCGKYVKRLSFGTVSFQLFRHVQELCPKLETISIRSAKEETKYSYVMQGSTTVQSERRTYPQFPKLISLRLESNHFLANKEDFANLLKACKNLESLFLNFSTAFELSQALDLLIGNLSMTALKALTISFGKRVGSDDEYGESETTTVDDEVVLRLSHVNQIAALSQHGAELEKLDLIAGIWEDLTCTALQNLLSTYSQSLKHFTIAGNLHGIDLQDKELVVTVPKLDSLVSFAMGSSYEFEEIIENPNCDSVADSSTPRSVRRNTVVSLTDKHLISLVVNFPYIMSSLESIQLGNLMEIEKIHPKTFPRLKVFRIGSAWNKSIDIPVSDSVRRFPVFPLVTQLQLPDCLKDEFLVQKISKLFPQVRKVWINLPSVKCLRHFFQAMSDTHLTELYLKTQYDFEHILESALLAHPRSQKKNRSRKNYQDACTGTADSLAQLQKLKNPDDGDKVYNEFIRFHNIELPLEVDDEILQTSQGIGSLSSLRVLHLEHVSRRLRIPMNNQLPHYHQLQTFHPTLTIGFTEYPLRKQFFQDEIQKLRNLESFKCGHNIQHPSRFVLPSMCSYTVKRSLSHHSYKEFDIHNIDDEEGSWENSVAFNFDSGGSISKNSKRLKVKILPSALANDQFKVKPEKIERLEPEINGNGSSTGISMNIKNEIESDEDD